ncbi:MAG: AAA family ATPase [Fluviicola sp.]|nr:AAA family ATPase [Fluviicola sp.]
MIPRIQYTSIKEKIFNNRLLMLSGPRAVGKKEMVQQILTEENQAFLELNAAKKSVKKMFDEVNELVLKNVFGDHRFVILQEAQYVDKLQLIIEEILSGNFDVTLIMTC